MKVYVEKYDTYLGSYHKEIRLFGISGDWYEDYEEHGGLHFSELFTSYREASMWLLEQGYKMEFDHFEFRLYGKQKLVFTKDLGETFESVTIEEMELIK